MASPLIPSAHVKIPSFSFRQESSWLLKNAVPLVISYLLQNSLQSVSVITAGHLVSSLSRKRQSMGKLTI
jgi:MATE family multidrug resistance protein